MAPFRANIKEDANLDFELDVSVTVCSDVTTAIAWHIRIILNIFDAIQSKCRVWDTRFDLE
jgi:hypothetical protein